MARLHGFDDAAIHRLLAGEIVASAPGETTDKQLAVTVAMITRADLGHVADTLLDGRIMGADETILGFARIDPEAPEAALSRVSLADAEAVEELLTVEPGSDFNFSSEEIATLRQVAERHGSGPPSEPAVAAAVSEAYRAILAGRLRSYLEGGLKGLAPYDRGEDGLTLPAEELRAAAEAMDFLREAPDLYRALVEYPLRPVDDVEHAFFWLEQDSDDRPRLMLLHVMVQRRQDGLIFLARAFYATRSFNGSQVAASAVPTRQGNAVFYTSRASSDEVDGLLSSVRQTIGRGVVRDSALESLRAAREVWGR